MLPHNPKDPVSLFYAKTFDREWVLLVARASFAVQGVLRTASGCYLDEHPLPREGLNPEWRWAEWHGLYDGSEFKGVWSGW